MGRRTVFVMLLLMFGDSRQARPTPSADNAAACRFSREDVAADLELFEEELARSWSFRTLRAVDVPQVIRHAAQTLPPSIDGPELYDLLSDLVARLQDGHASADVPCVTAERDRCWPFAVRDTEEGLIIDTGVGPVKRGDRLVSLDAIGVEELVDKASDNLFARGRETERLVAILRIQRTQATRVRFTVATAEGARREANLDTVACAQLFRPQIESRMLSGGIGYLRIRYFFAPDWPAWLTATLEHQLRLIAPVIKAIDEAFAKLDSSQKLILDLRGNPGGTDQIATRVSDHLLTPGYVYSRVSWPQPDGSWSIPQAYRRAESMPLYRGRVVVLIDGGTGSAAENLAVCLRDAERAVAFVGRSSAGASGAPRTLVLPRTRAVVTFSKTRIYGPNGALIEGAGVEPDIKTTWHARDVLEGNDPDLRAAIMKLKR